MREDDALEGNRPESLGADIIPFLRRRQKRMEHLDGRLEHFDELKKALVRVAQAAREAVGIRIILAETLELADVHLARKGRNVLVVLVARLRLGDSDLSQFGRHDLDDLELRDVAIELVQALDGPRAHDAGQAMTINVVALAQQVGEFVRSEQAQW